ncbi:exported hypothetical protein [Vibrio coralliirubri]|uniref:outer membrane protein n=1 Tax=Vibrio coralliirubri TaxID=1516159 RepID=UPI000632CA59|nr:outer membrane beta-barrel protein [Vibrio coralliirubri]CDT33696.1 exported hypothetical protein [Vibrio coralliirubri]
MFIKNIILSVFFVFYFGVNSSFAGSQDVKILIGGKQLDSSWGLNRTMDSFGLKYSYFPMSSPLAITVDWIGHSSSDSLSTGKSDSYISDFNFGLKVQPYVITRNLRPFIGGGLSIVSAEIDYLSSDSISKHKDVALGYWVGGGADYIVSDHWILGIDSRYVVAETDVSGKDKKLGGFGWGITLGYIFR